MKHYRVTDLTWGIPPSNNPAENVIVDEDVYDPDADSVRLLYRKGSLMPRVEADKLKVRYIENTDGPNAVIETKRST